MGTENSSSETKERATILAKAMGSYHISLFMDTVIRGIVDIFTTMTAKRPVFRVHGGTQTENLALQNIQARLRMLLSYFFSQLLLWTRGRQGSLLVLGSANVDEM
jgi:NAD+ synthase (glutamine-hydrolysing)